MILSQITEVPFNIIGQSLYFFCWYWTVGFPNVSSRVGFQVFFCFDPISELFLIPYQYLMLCVIFPLYYTTFSQAIAAFSPNAEIAGLIFSFLFSFVITFNGESPFLYLDSFIDNFFKIGVLQPFSQLIKFWHWMYRLSPFTCQ